ncbi:hypothetical protein PWT90_07415 [Aphanocladium album]|nr:hypothetical protein PWT90_07415 [Aphanocladium album]
MDPLSGISIACNAIQLFEVAFKLASGAVSIYHSTDGMAAGTLCIESVASHVLQLSDEILVDKKAPAQLSKLAKQSKMVATDLLAVLHHLKSKRQSKLGSFKAALQTLWNEKRIQEFLNDIQRLQSLIMTAAQFIMMSQQSDLYQEMQAITRINREFCATFHNDLLELRTDIIWSLERLASVVPSAATGMAIDGADQMPPSQPLRNEDEVMAGLDHLSASLAQLQQDIDTTKRVEPSHIRTLHWAFERQLQGAHDKVRLHFREWLETGSGVFWIRGKAGSGKSTLMKYLCDHSRTADCLRIWATAQGRDSVVVGKYFFWNPGSPLQKFLEGLLRSLVFDILRLCPQSLVNVGVTLRQRRTEILEAEEELWTLDLLWEIIEDTISENQSTCFCFFIDGLDEFSGDNEDLIDAVRKLCSHENTKVCASSRPWAEFVSEFGEDDTRLLKLEDFNSRDIKEYVHHKLLANAAFKRLAANDATVLGLVEEVAVRSSGVFLWVHLVVRSLLEGAKYADTTQFLWKRLEAFPRDLDGFFSHMLDTIPQIYHAKTVMAIRATLAATASLPAAVYYFMNAAEEDERYSLLSEWNDMTPDLVVRLVEDTALRLDGWTKGLLEVVHYSRDKSPTYDFSKVEFLHRTVRDFLFESKSAHAMLGQNANLAMEVPELMCHGLLAYVKRHNDGRKETEARAAVMHALYHASFVTNILRRMHSLHPVLDQVGCRLYGPGWTERWTNTVAMCMLAAEYGLDDYIAAMVSRDPAILRQRTDLYSTMLATALVPRQKRQEHRISSDARLITARYLIAMGGSMSRNPGTLETFLRSLGPGISGDEAIFEMLCLLTTAGADLGVRYGESVFRDEIENLFPRQKALKLLSLEVSKIS